MIDIPSGRQHDIALPEGWNTLSEAGILGWDGDRLYAVIAHFGTPRRLRLVEIDANSGALRTVVEEASDTRLQLNVYSYNRPAVAILPGQDTAVWFSQRDGWGHLYRVRLSDGKVLRQLTRGKWVVRDLLGVDAAGGWAYFSAGGVDGGDPYVRGLYRVSLQGGPIQRLAPMATTTWPMPVPARCSGRAPQALSPGGGYLVDTVSRLDQPPRTVLRASDDGREVMVLEAADDSAIVAAGWRAPRRERLLAPMDARRSSPPSTCPATIAMMAASGDRRDVRWFLHQQCAGDLRRAVSALNPVSRASLAELGFMVVSIDARGTGGRNKAFHDSSFLRAADVQLDDHVAALRQLGERYPGIDLERVGIYGHSFGGYSAARALLRYPTFYKVGVASAGSHNFQGMYGGALRHGPAVRWGAAGHAQCRRRAGALCRARQCSTGRQPARASAAGLWRTGRERATGADPAAGAALNKAQRSYDLLYLARQDHELFRNDATYTHRMWDYFVRHLAGQQPPDTVLAPLAGGPG